VREKKMKNTLLRALTAALTMLLPAGAFAALAGSAHDLTDDFVGATTDPCEFCHVPHSLNPDSPPLWNHTLTAQTFTMYGVTIKGNAPDATPNEPSLRCLSCHDGVTNVDAFGGAVGTTDLDSKFPATTAVIGITLGDDHPVSIGLTGLPAGAQANAEAAGLVFYDDGGTPKTECLSCHDPHDPTNAPFLRIPGNRLCAACHIDK
jgi:predicted CXXCH cytochrome family protein